MNVVWIVLFGLAWGSFLNVVIYRLPRGLNLATPPSACPGCGKRIRPWDNVPVLSYLILRGKCRACGFHIPVSYFLVEVLTPAALLLVFRHHGSEFGVPFFASALFTSAMISLAFIDYHDGVVPDAITLPGTLAALVYGIFRNDVSFRQSLVGAVVGSAFLLAVYGAYLLIRRKEGLGMGDVTMMLVIGAFLGWPRTILTLILGSFAGSLIGIMLIVARKKDMQTALPFGTFLAPAAFAAMLWGDRIIRAYLSLYKR